MYNKMVIPSLGHRQKLVKPNHGTMYIYLGQEQQYSQLRCGWIDNPGPEIGSEAKRALYFFLNHQY